MDKEAFDLILHYTHLHGLSNLRNYLVELEEIRGFEACKEFIDETFLKDKAGEIRLGKKEDTPIEELIERELNSLADEMDREFQNNPNPSKKKKLPKKDLGFKNDRNDALQEIEIKSSARRELIDSRLEIEDILDKATIRFTDKREKHGEKDDIKAFWKKNKDNYMTDNYKFTSSRRYNQNKIAKAIKKDGGFTSHEDTIKDHAGLNDILG